MLGWYIVYCIDFQSQPNVWSTVVEYDVRLPIVQFLLQNLWKTKIHSQQVLTLLKLGRRVGSANNCVCTCLATFFRCDVRLKGDTIFYRLDGHQVNSWWKRMMDVMIFLRKGRIKPQMGRNSLSTTKTWTSRTYEVIGHGHLLRSHLEPTSGCGTQVNTNPRLLQKFILSIQLQKLESWSCS